MLNVHPPLVPFFQEQGFPEQEALAIASAFVHKDISLAFLRLRLFPRWVAWFGMATAGIYALAQAELAAR